MSDLIDFLSWALTIGANNPRASMAVFAVLFALVVMCLLPLSVFS